MKLAAAIVVSGAILAAQTPSGNPLVDTSKALYAIAKNDVLKSADKIPDNLWSYQPTPEVRTVAQMFAHIADGQYEFCGVPAEGKMVQKDVEKTAKTKKEIMAAVKEAFAYCDAAYANMTDSSAAEVVPFFGRQATRIGIMDFNISHTMEHYGNLVTYMRLKNIVPPSSEGR
ncbi:conserved exported hypothetical protein [Candidatus Sulfopaludibacter sp. SbA3]|nr:conserved exported hypothetical protein [Candidatus Sulfopaludibacter sp. SbA3]